MQLSKICYAKIGIANICTFNKVLAIESAWIIWCHLLSGIGKPNPKLLPMQKAFTCYVYDHC